MSGIKDITFDLMELSEDELRSFFAEHPIDFLACADLHITDRLPPCRTDSDLLLTLRDKLRCINHIAEIADHSLIICAGDIFDRPLESKDTEHAVLQSLGRFSFPLWRVLPGNHDIPQHNLKLLSDSSYSLLSYIPCKAVHKAQLTDFDGTGYIGFVPFGLPRIVSPNTRVLACHVLTWPGNEPEPFPGAIDEGVPAQALLDENPHVQYIISGDNHASFVHRDPNDPNRAVINPGSLWRRRKNQWDHRPSVYGIHMDSSQIYRFMLPINPEHMRAEKTTAQQVGEVDTEETGDSSLIAGRIIADRIKPESITAFTSALSADQTKHFDFRGELRKAATGLWPGPGITMETVTRAEQLLLTEVDKI